MQANPVTDRIATLPDAPAIRVTRLHKNYGNTRVLNGVDLTVAEGEVVCIIGPSGSGKSTLLRCLNRLEVPSSGEVEVLGQTLAVGTRQLVRIRRDIGMVFQHFNLFPHMTPASTSSRTLFTYTHRLANSQQLSSDLTGNFQEPATPSRARY